MRNELQAFIDEIDVAFNDDSDGGFEHKVLVAVAKLFGGQKPAHQVLSEVYSELHRIERGGGAA